MPSAHQVITTQPPPTTIAGIIGRLGPGLIIAGSIVGSGELIATTKSGAEAGFALLWLILLGCVIKVFAQVEFGRYSINTGNTTMDGMNELPGPRFKVSWIVWYWLVMQTFSIAQLGGIVGAVGVALALSLPLSGGHADAPVRGDFNQLLIRQQFWDERTAARRDELVQEYAAALQSDDWDERQAALRSVEANVKGMPRGERPTRERFAALFPHLDKRLEDYYADDYDNLLERYVERFGWAWDVDTEADRDALVEAAANARQSDDVAAYKAAWRDINGELAEMAIGERPSQDTHPTRDDVIWAALIATVTSAMLIVGRYNFIQTVATALVATFTLITIGNLFSLQTHEQWAVRWSDLSTGLSFSLPEMTLGSVATPLATALAAFGIIGVGAAEIVAYPYWCLAKGYARFTGPRDDTPAWVERARGWLRVMRWDAWCSMVIYTFATVAFFLLGAAVLHRQNLNPTADQLVPTLAEMYRPAFGAWAPALFLFGAVAVLYSTFFVAIAGNSRVCSDAVRIFGFRENTEAARRLWTQIFCGAFPFVCLFIYSFYRKPGALVLASGIIQAIMLPMLAAAALYFRYHRCDDRIAPGAKWDVFLWLSAFGLLIAGSWAALVKIVPAIQLIGS